MRQTIHHFRIWDRVKECWLENCFINPQGKIAVITNDNNIRFINSYSFDINVSTGFVDKNRKEIFEGDIIKIYKKWMNFIPYPVKAQVFWSITENNFCLRNARELFRVGFGDWSDIKNYEVIGNIYENPNFEFDDNL